MSHPVVLVHGLGASAQRTWRDNGWVDLLTDAGRPVVAPDLLGHADPDPPLDPEAYDALEDELGAQLPDGPLDAVGFSLGARSLLVLAARKPERFHRLVIAGVGANLIDGGTESAALADALDADPDDVPAWAHYFRGQAVSSGTDPRALAALLRRPSPTALDDEALARITCPVLLVIGSDDFAGPPEPLAERLSDVEVRILPGVDHFATPKQMGFLDAALRFLDV